MMPLLHLCVIYGLLFLSLSFAQSPPRPCRLGRILVNGRCQVCPPGTFSDTFSGNQCTPCPAGTFSPFRGARARRLCVACPEDTFNNRTGATECMRCPPGTRAERGLTQCLACGPGTRVNFRRCTPCPRGMFSNGTANLRCDPCPFPLTSPRGSSSINMCRTCPPGRFGEFCEPCFDGTFKPEREGRCEDCPPGQISPPGATRCFRCREGTFKTFSRRGSRLFACIPCRTGLVAARGSTVCRIEGAPCPMGSFEARNGACISCGDGFFQNRTTQTCERCPPGSTSVGRAQDRCIACQGDLEPDSQNRLCRCPQGFFLERGQCRPCPAGTGGSFINSELRGIESCILCSPGSFSDRPGSTSCEQCPSGTFADQEGATLCRPCPEGSVQVADAFLGRESCLFLDTGCSLGFRSQNSFNGFCRVVGCQPKTREEDIGITCLKCGAGRFVNERDTCRDCPANEFSVDGKVNECSPCANGKTRNFFNGSLCSCNGVNRFGFVEEVGRGLQNGVCRRCPRGTFSNSNIFRFDAGNDLCTECPPGSFTDRPGQVRCTRCGPNTFASGSRSSECISCPPGTTGNTFRGSTRCIPE
eukprot:GFKZ01006991.1.p1 GENE.GFKZ01006991.1~~GFKZ01006991.1.p1  ORF type:complete len:587 (+),score=-48.11 GFKZ01006991.1:145-1905(+)